MDDADAEQGHGVIRIVSWNINHRQTKGEAWKWLENMANAGEADVALLQEAEPPPEETGIRADIGPRSHWDSHVWNSQWYKGSFPHLYCRWAMVARLSDRVRVEHLKQVSPIEDVNDDEIAVSGIGTIAAAMVTPVGESEADPFLAVSMYARWMGRHPRAIGRKQWSMSDTSAHRIISDISSFIANKGPPKHRILAAGDLNIAFGAVGRTQSVPERERTVWDRMEALGLEFMGPQYPNGERAEDPPADLPSDTLNVKTHRNNQIDYVFASRGFHNSVTTRALNRDDEWGPSDHCRLLIEVS